MKQLFRIILTLLVFLVVLSITIFADAIILRQGLLHHPYMPGISVWIDRAFLLITLGLPFVAAFLCYRLTGKSKTRSMGEGVQP